MARRRLTVSLTPFYQTTWRDIRKYCCTHARIHHHGNNKWTVALRSLLFIPKIIKRSRSSIRNIMHLYYEAPKLNYLKSNIYFILGHTIMRFLVKLAASHKAFVQPTVHVHLPFGAKNLCLTQYDRVHSGERSVQRVIFRARGSSVDSTQFST